MSLSGDKGVAQFKKSVKMGHPNLHAWVQCINVTAARQPLKHENDAA